MIDRPQMLVEEFEHIARNQGETVRLEFLHGKLGVKAVPDGDHVEMIRWITKQFLVQRPDLWLYSEVGVKVQAYRDGRARVDGVLAAEGALAGRGEWIDPAVALLVVEVTSYDSDTNRRGRVEKPRAFAEAGIPIYLLIDRDNCEVVVFNRPEGGVYTSTFRYAFGKSVELPELVGVVLESEALKAWVR